MEADLSAAGFLEDEVFEQLRRERRNEFAAGPIREAAHAGAAYPDDPAELLPDAPEPLPPPPIEATPDDPGGDPGGVPEPA